MSFVISKEVKSYISGFLDGDGCIMFQLVRRKDYIYGYQIRASIVFYQKIDRHNHLLWLKSILKYGYIRDRKDMMTEYTIVGIKPVIEILGLLAPYVRLKKEHIKLALKINKVLKGKFNIKKFLKASLLVDKFGELNYSKKRINTTKVVKKFLEEHKLFPRND
ncbi:MAG: site-specific DNA endonuclease [Parcubacteria group bacterium Athens1014_10]|nr:MAG: site-specific DNA endonuclease [Parcubacteria group bacterium Athens1014_10]TSD05896.1 MAG: site-specific DNA endonuclease [Parcubacteria group bacterium Athens0714_12]